MNKQHILDEIRRTAAANGGTPIGRQRFERETGIKRTDWYGRYWARWGDAIKEAGFTPNRLQHAFSDDDVLPKLVGLIRELRRYPTHGEMRMRERLDDSFPSHGVFTRLGSKQDWLHKVVAYCATHADHDDVAAICTPLLHGDSTAASSDRDDDEDVGLETGYVYLALMKVGKEKRYKIGKADIVGRRTKQVAVNLPEDLELIHAIATDDAYGIEAYWHKRFDEKRRGGEWFVLTAADVKAFRRRKFM
jgi:hypothetical protein